MILTMAYGLIGIYALYLIFVGFNGNAKAVLTDIESDASGFAPWLLAIVALKALASSDTIAPAVRPFIALAIVTFIVKNYGQLVGQLNQITGLKLPGGTSQPTQSILPPSVSDVTRMVGVAQGQSAAPLQSGQTALDNAISSYFTN